MAKAALPLPSDGLTVWSRLGQALTFSSWVGGCSSVALGRGFLKPLMKHHSPRAFLFSSNALIFSLLQKTWLGSPPVSHPLAVRS